MLRIWSWPRLSRKGWVSPLPQVGNSIPTLARFENPTFTGYPLAVPTPILCSYRGIEIILSVRRREAAMTEGKDPCRHFLWAAREYYDSTPQHPIFQTR
jgi:hypothetical protein